MKKKNSIVRVIILFLTIIVSIQFYSCDYSYLDIEEIEYTYNPTFALPLIKSSFSLDNIIDVDTVDALELDDNILIIAFDSIFKSQPASELFEIDDQAMDFYYGFDPRTKTTVVDTVFRFVYPGEERIDNVILLQGFLNTDAQSPEIIADGYDIEISLTIPDSKCPQGEPFTISFDLGDNVDPVDLDGYEIVFYTNEEGENYFDMEYTIIVKDAGVRTNAPYEIYFSNTITDIEYDELYGYIYRFDFNVGTGDIGLGLFDLLDEGKIRFANPAMFFEARNYIGAPIDVRFDEFYMINHQGIREDLFYGEEFDPWELNTPEEINSFAITEAELDSTNTDLFDAFQDRPKEFIFDLNGYVNIRDSDVNFLKHNMGLETKMTLEIPLNVKIESIGLKDTLAFSFDNDSGIDNIGWFEFHINILNEFPFNGDLQVSFADENYNPIDYLFDLADPVRFFEAGKINPAISTTRTSEPGETNISIGLSGDKLDNIAETEYLLLHIQLNTPIDVNDEYFNIYYDYNIDVTIKAKGAFDISGALELNGKNDN